MSFKNPLTIQKLKMVKPQMYIKTLTAILKNKFKDGDTVPFSLILNHIYNGFDQSKSEKLPFFLLGQPKDGETNWKKFRDSAIDKSKKQKDFMLVGTCTRQGDTLVLEINKSKGVSKLPKKTKTRLEALLKKINKNLTVSTKGGVEEDNSTEENTDNSETTDKAGAAAGAVGRGMGGNDQPKEDKTSKKENKRKAKK